MELKDVGKQVRLTVDDCPPKTITPTVVMGIKAPGGKMFLFERGDTEKQVVAIKAFMKKQRRIAHVNS